MKNNFKKPISILLSMLIAATSSAAALTATAETAQEAASAPVVYNNTYDESYVAEYYGNGQQTKEEVYTLKTETDGNVCAYYQDYDPNHWYRRAIAIYNPETAAEQALTNFTNEYARLKSSVGFEHLDQSKLTRTYKVSLRYKTGWVRKDEGDGNIYMGLRLAHLNNWYGIGYTTQLQEIANICQSTEVRFFTIDSQVSNWTNIEAYVSFNVTDQDWQYGLALYLDGAGEVYLDDIKVEDYTDTNALFANLTVDGTAVGNKVLYSATDLPQYVDQKIVKNGWYTDEAMTQPFDFDSYDLSAGRQINLYAATAGVVYENTFDEEYVSYIYGTDDRIFEYKGEKDSGGYEYVKDTTTGNGYIKYLEGDNHHWFNRPLTIYDPVNALKHYNMQGQNSDEILRTNGALRYADNVAADMVRLYKVSFRYACTWLNGGEEIYVGLRMTHINSYVGNNDGSQNTATQFYTIKSQTSWDDGKTGWTNVEAYVLFTVPAACRDWQHGLSLYLNGRGGLVLDDLVVEDYTDTNYSLVNTYIDSSEPTKQAIMPISSLNPLDEGYSWYTGPDMQTAFTDFTDRTSGSEEKLSVDLYGVPYGEGDANGDNAVNAQDLAILRLRILTEGKYIQSIDLDKNGVLNVIDLIKLKKNI